MHGKQTLKITSKRLEYNLTFLRNVTIIRGDSGTGKTTLCSIISEHLRTKKDSAYKIHCTCLYRVLSDDWDDAILQINSYKNHLLFVDEDANFLESLEFAELIMNSSNYFVIITRSTIKNIPYSYKEVYELFSVYVGNTTIVTNTQFYKTINNSITTDCIITEDTKSGYIMMKALCGDNVVDLTENDIKYGVGNNKLLSRCQALARNNHKVFILADGAAIGYFIDGLYKEMLSNRNIVLWLPESFEYLLLLSGIVWRRDVPTVLKDPSEQIYSELFPTWERFFTWLVTDIMSGCRGHNYVKGILKPWYYNSANLDKFERIIPDSLKHLVDKHPSDR